MTKGIIQKVFANSFGKFSSTDDINEAYKIMLELIKEIENMNTFSWTNSDGSLTTTVELKKLIGDTKE